MRQLIAVSVLATLLAPVGPARATTETPKSPAAPHVAGEVIVRYSSGATSASTWTARRRSLGLSLVRRDSRLGSDLVRVPPGTSVADTVALLNSDPTVEYAEPNYTYRSDVEPNDPGYPDQWPLGEGQGAIEAPDAWTVTSGTADVRVAVIDTGVDLSHPDLAPNLWINPGEVPDNLIDDDANGYVDDVHGFDWADIDNDPEDAHGHGTHVAGIAAARGNDAVGVTGVSWRSRIVALRALDEQGLGTTFELAQAFSYAADKGIRVVNASLGGSGYSLTLEQAIADAPGTLFVVSSGNGGSDGVGDDNDAAPSYPCNFELDNILCVAASTRDDSLADFSNYGATSVDLAAPGVDILSTLKGDGYAIASGTSMATPFVAGTATLLWSVAPGASVASVKKAILDGADERPGLEGVTVSGARLNAFGALASLAPQLIPDAEPEPEPEPEPSLESGLDVAKKRAKLVADGWVTPGQRGAHTIKVVLKKKKDGRFKRIARRDPFLDLYGDVSVYTARFPRPKRGRCRIVSTFVDDDGSKTKARRTFNC